MLTRRIPSDEYLVLLKPGSAGVNYQRNPVPNAKLPVHVIEMGFYCPFRNPKSQCDNLIRQTSANQGCNLAFSIREQRTLRHRMTIDDAVLWSCLHAH